MAKEITTHVLDFDRLKKYFSDEVKMASLEEFRETLSIVTNLSFQQSATKDEILSISEETILKMVDLVQEFYNRENTKDELPSVFTGTVCSEELKRNITNLKHIRKVSKRDLF